jgi:hypothetical protein
MLSGGRDHDPFPENHPCCFLRQYCCRLPTVVGVPIVDGSLLLWPSLLLPWSPAAVGILAVASYCCWPPCCWWFSAVSGSLFLLVHCCCWHPCPCLFPTVVGLPVVADSLLFLASLSGVPSVAYSLLFLASLLLLVPCCCWPVHCCFWRPCCSCHFLIPYFCWLPCCCWRPLCFCFSLLLASLIFVSGL